MKIEVDPPVYLLVVFLGLLVTKLTGQNGIVDDLMLLTVGAIVTVASKMGIKKDGKKEEKKPAK